MHLLKCVYFLLCKMLSNFFGYEKLLKQKKMIKSLFHMYNFSRLLRTQFCFFHQMVQKIFNFLAAISTWIT